ncbi:MAG: hypothetical protein GYA22_15215 [Bacteroidales bacterium]|jgi:hypothetical protein|nr:hypothetical protein [Bacteroidales bacterium]
MGILLRILQQYDPASESSFMDLERMFQKLEIEQSNFPKGKRFQPLAGAENSNTLIWQAEFPDLEAAGKALNFFQQNPDHERLFRQQVLLIKNMRIELYKSLDL